MQCDLDGSAANINTNTIKYKANMEFYDNSSIMYGIAR